MIPVRDEARRLPALLDSLAALDPPPHEVIVVDDGSVDATAAIAAAAGVTVVAAGNPPPGWLGKPWACQRGALLASGSHLLFLDADVVVERTALDVLGEAYRSCGGGLVSVQPYHRTIRRYEDLSAYFNAAAMMGTGVFSSWLGGAATAAFGPCLYTSTEAYSTSGGHREVRHEIVEDLALARRYRSVGLPVCSFSGGRTVVYRMYGGGPAQLVEGWSKNIAAGAAGGHPVAVAGTTLWIGAHVVAGWRVLTGLAALARRRRPRIGGLVLVGATIVHQRRLLRQVGSFRLATTVAFPIPLAVFVATFTRSAFLTACRRKVTWKGRVIALDAPA